MLKLNLCHLTLLLICPNTINCMCVYVCVYMYIHKYIYSYFQSGWLVKNDKFEGREAFSSAELTITNVQELELSMAVRML